MKKNLVNYNGKENYEVDLSSLKSKLSVPGRVTLFVSTGSCFELTDDELAVIKGHECWKHCFQHKYPSKVNPPKEDKTEEPDKKTEEPGKKTKPKTLTKKPV